MEILYAFLGVFLISLIVIRLITKKFNYLLAGRIAISSMLVLTAAGHFIYSHGMVMMMPDFLPFKELLVYLTGVLEIAAAIGLLIPKFQGITSILLIIFFIMILPANINAAMHNISLSTGNNTGPGPEYLWFRIPLQLLFIGLVYFFGIKSDKKDKSQN